MSGDLDLEGEVLEVLDRWDRRLEIATAAWADLTSGERQRRSARLDAAGESDEWVVVLWNWWNEARLVDQEQLRRDVSVLGRALWAAAAEGRLDAESEEADSARHLLSALERMAAILGVG